MFAKNLLKVLPLFLFFPMISLAAAKYPQVSEVRGTVYMTGKDGKKQSLKKSTPLIERALFETTEGAIVKVLLDADRSFTVQESSEVLLPTISWEGGEAPVILLKKGELRWQQLTDNKPAYNVALRSDLFEFLAPKGDFIFSINPAKAYAGVKVIKGSMEFSALNGEESSHVTAGHEAGFQGIIESGEIAYDILLKGKKIPRGNLTPVVAMSKKDLDGFADEVMKQKKADAQKKALDKKAAEDAKKSGAICSSPAAKFNQCVWVCLNNPKKEKKACLTEKEGVSCVRRRCNANGVWAEESPVDAQKSGIQCKAQPVVAPCDY